MGTLPVPLKTITGGAAQRARGDCARSSPLALGRVQRLGQAALQPRAPRALLAQLLCLSMACALWLGSQRMRTRYCKCQKHCSWMHALDAHIGI